MSKITACLTTLFVLGIVKGGYSVIYTYEDVELRRIFPSEFPQDTLRRTGAVDPEHLGRYAELKDYFRKPKSKLNLHFEELICYIDHATGKKVCKLDLDRYSPAEEGYFQSKNEENYIDKRRVFCFMLICFTEDELDRVVSSF